MRFTLVLGGGGLRGLAHIGALEALCAAGLEPVEVIGNSVGSLVGAAWCNGVSTGDLREVAEHLQRSDVFRIAHRDMAFKRMLSPAVYRREPLEHLVRALIGGVTFDGLERPLLVNTADINSGTPVVWGLPGLRDLPVAEAVYASCALPGIFPPQEIRGRYYVDGATISNLPVAIAARTDVDFVLAVDVGAASSLRRLVEKRGFATLYARAAEVMMQRLLESQIRGWRSPPLILVRPRLEQISLFSFAYKAEVLAEGARAMRAVVEAPWFPPPAGQGVYPRRRVTVEVDERRCIGCEACLAHGPDRLFSMNARGKAECLRPHQEWSPLDGGYVRVCPTGAIMAHPVDGDGAEPFPLPSPAAAARPDPS